ncbi:2-C-methyl-D-erythritol 4-phosphate cytidylyltransferase [Thermoleophilia bacterium SCSIO 60948]|nr:2-C-methyl-D-erythritol 4-phosphate cytidylyltransferase [Thermoleophilia bacterium SCSIO 60948]
MRPSPPERGDALALIAAAGSGQRLGAGRPKALIEAGGRTLLAHSLRNAAASPSLRGAVVAGPPEWLGETRAAVDAAGLGPEFAVTIVPGAGSRSASVAAALAEADSELVAVHDAARIFAPPELFTAVLGALGADPALDGAVAAARVSDTVKLAAPTGGEGTPYVEQTLDRDRLWAIQTPQAFRTAALRSAIERASAEELAAATDDAALIEAAGGRVGLVAADPANAKLTTPSDLRLAEARLAGG